MNDHAHFIQQQTNTLLEKQKRAWDLFLYWMDQSDDDVMTMQKKQEFLDCLDEEEGETARPVTLPIPINPNSLPPSPQGAMLPQCG
jgi:hypothetical protein